MSLLLWYVHVDWIVKNANNLALLHAIIAGLALMVPNENTNNLVISHAIIVGLT